MTSLLLTLAMAPGFHPPVPPPVPVFPPVPVVAPGYPAFFNPQPVLTVEQFAKVFVPTPGHHRVVLIHPKSCKPVEVCFVLPANCGCPKINYNRHHLEFEYRKYEVDIRFRHNGTVDVKTD